MQVEKRELSWRKFFVVLLITTIIFMFGIFIGNYISSKKVYYINDMQNDLRTEISGIEIQYELLKENPCSNISIDSPAEQLYELSEKLAYMERTLGKGNKNVLKLKEYYSLLEIKHWLFLKKYNDVCNTNLMPILYFYSNLGDCDDCERQGYVLSYIRNKYDEVYIYSFDINLKNNVLNLFKKMYSIGEKTPIIIINNIAYPEFKDSEEINNILGYN